VVSVELLQMGLIMFLGSGDISAGQHRILSLGTNEKKIVNHVIRLSSYLLDATNPNR